MRGVVALVLSLGALLNSTNARCATASSKFRVEALAAKDPATRVALYTQAIETWTPADEIGNKSLCLNNRAKALTELKQYDKALSDLNSAISLEPNDALYHENRGDILKRLGQFDSALSDLNRALELDPHRANSLKLRGEAHEKLNELDKARADYERAMVEDPRLAGPWINRGSMFIRQKKMDLALLDLDKALSLEPKNEDALSIRGLIFVYLRDYKRALADLNRISDPTLSVPLSRGRMSLRLGHCDDALKDIDRGLSLEPENVGGLLDRAEAYRRLKNPEKEMADLERAVAVSSITARPRVSRGSAFLLRGMLKDAEADALKAASLNPKFKGADVLLGRVSFERGAYEDAGKRFEAVLAAKSTDDAALLGLAFTHFKSGKIGEARANWKKALEVSPFIAEGQARIENEGYFLTAKEAQAFKSLQALPKP